MLRPDISLALAALLLSGCSSLPTGPTSALELGPSHPMVRPDLVPFETGESSTIVDSLLVPLPPATSLATGKDPLADAGRHVRIQMTVSAGDTATIESVTVGAGAARAYLTDSQELVVSLLAKNGERLASIGVRQPLIEHVYVKQGRKSERDGADLAKPHGTRVLSSVPLTVFLPSIDGAEKVEVRFGGDKGRVAAEYWLP